MMPAHEALACRLNALRFFFPSLSNRFTWRDVSGCLLLPLLDVTCARSTSRKPRRQRKAVCPDAERWGKSSLALGRARGATAAFDARGAGAAAAGALVLAGVAAAVQDAIVAIRGAAPGVITPGVIIRAARAAGARARRRHVNAQHVVIRRGEVRRTTVPHHAAVVKIVRICHLIHTSSREQI